MSLLQTIKEKATGPVLGLGMLALVGCNQDRVTEAPRMETYESYGVVSAKEVFPAHDLRKYGLKQTNSKGERFVDDHFLWVSDVPEFPSTSWVINSPELYNSTAVGDTVDLVFRGYEHWVVDSRGKSKPIDRTSIIDYSPRGVEGE